MKLAAIFQIFVLFSSCESFIFGRAYGQKIHAGSLVYTRNPYADTQELTETTLPEFGSTIRRRSLNWEPHFERLAWKLRKVQEALRLGYNFGRRGTISMNHMKVRYVGI